MASSSNQPSLTKEFHKWLTETMHISENNKFKICLRPEEYKVLMSDQYKKIWLYIIRNVQPTKEVKQIKGNLLLSSNQNKIKRSKNLNSKVNAQSESEDLGQLYNKHTEILNESLEIDKTLSTLEKDINRLKGEIWVQQSHLDRNNKDLITHSCTKKLFDEVGKMLNGDKGKVKELMGMIEERVRGFENMDKKSGPHEKGMIVRSYDDDHDRMKDVVKCLDLIEKHYQHMLKLKDVDCRVGSAGTKKEKEEIEGDIKRLMLSYTPPHIIASLVDVISQSCCKLRELSANKKNKRGDASNVCNMIKKLKEEIVDRFVMSEQLKNEMFACERMNESLNKSCKQSIRERYGDQHFTVVEKILENFELEKESAILKDAFFAYEGHLKRLRAQVLEGQQKQEVVKGKYQKILNMEKILIEKENLMLHLMKTNPKYSGSILKQQNQIICYVKKNFIGQLSRYSNCISQSQHSLHNEVELFNRIGLHSYRLLSNSQSNASIHLLLGNPAWPFSQLANELLEILEFPRYKSMDDLLLFIATIIMNIHSHNEDHHHHRQLTLDHETSANSQYVFSLIEELKNLGLKLSKAEKEHVDKYEPIMIKRVAQAQRSLVVCNQIKRDISNWWHQPAQTLVPWMLVDGLNVKEWLDKWRSSANKLKQKKNIK